MTEASLYGCVKDLEDREPVLDGSRDRRPTIPAMVDRIPRDEPCLVELGRAALGGGLFVNKENL